MSKQDKKILKSYRFDPDAVKNLDNLAKKLQTTRTDVLEILIDWFNIETSKNPDLLKRLSEKYFK